MPAVELNGEEIYYVRGGALRQAQDGGHSGPPVVFIHGAGGTHRRWLPQIGALANCTCYALDLPAHGQSTGAGRSDIAAYAEVVAGFLDALRLSSAVIGGHSMGGAIALWLALHDPARVRGLILAGTGARLRVHPNILQAAKEGRPTTPALVTSSAPAAQPIAKDAEAAPVDAAVAYGDWVACDRFDVMGRVQEIACPALIMVGADDIMTPPKYAAYMHQRIKGSRLVTIDGAGHNPMLDKPDEVTKAIQEFVDSFQ